MTGEVGPSEQRKRAAALAACDLIDDGMQLGLGTGSTIAHLLEAIAARRLQVAGVPTSQATTAACRRLGIELLGPEEVEVLDLAIDGADEIDPWLNATKGGGGALLREKVVASMAERFVLVATTEKVVDRLADAFPLPIEVVPFAVTPVQRWLGQRGYEGGLRLADGEAPFITDNGNHILDLRHPGGIEDPAVEEIRINQLPGVVTPGLFVDMAQLALLADAHGNVVERTVASR